MNNQRQEAPRKPLGQWLIENAPRGVNLEIPGGRESRRQIPFVAAEDEIDSSRIDKED